MPVMRCTGLCFLFLLGCLPPLSAHADRRSDQWRDLQRRGQLAREDGLPALSERQYAQALTLARTPDERMETLLGLSEALLGQSRYPEALENLHRADKEEGSSKNRVRLALLRSRVLENQDLPEAILTLQTALENIPKTEADRPEVLLALGRILFRSGRFEESAKTFESYAASRTDPAEMAALDIEWAEALQRAGQLAGAEARLRKVTRSAEPGVSQFATLRLARYLAESSRLDEARAAIGPLLEADATPPPVRADAWIEMSRLWEMDSHYKEAGEALEKAASQPDLPLKTQHLIALSRGRLALLKGEEDQGRQWIREAIQQAPELPESGEAQLFLARHLAEREQWDPALEEYQRYLESYTDSDRLLDALLGRAACLYRLNRFSEAATQYERLSERPDTVQAIRIAALRGAAQSWIADGQTETARSFFRKVIDESPGSQASIEAEFQIAESFRMTGRGKESEQGFLNFLDQHPEHELAEQASLHLALLAETTGDWNKAFAIYTDMMVRYPNGHFSDRVAFSRGLIRYRLGSFEDALKIFEAVMRDHPQSRFSEQAMFMQGWCHNLSGRGDRALEICRQFLEQYPESPWISDVKFWIGETLYNRGEFPSAEAEFSSLGERRPLGPLTDRALYWAGRAALQAKEPLRAIGYFSLLVRDIPASPLLAEARFAQGDALRELGQFSPAILVYEMILVQDEESYLANRARIRLGDCHYTLAAEDPSRYEYALLQYHRVRAREISGSELAREADYKIGRCLEGMGRTDEAFEAYMTVLHDYSSSSISSEWVPRSGFSAAALKEKKGAWKEASKVYERLITRGGDAAADAQKRLNLIRLEQWKSL